jgi:hypothetical protein
MAQLQSPRMALHDRTVGEGPDAEAGKARAGPLVEVGSDNAERMSVEHHLLELKDVSVIDGALVDEDAAREVEVCRVGLQVGIESLLRPVVVNVHVRALEYRVRRDVCPGLEDVGYVEEVVDQAVPAGVDDGSAVPNRRSCSSESGSRDGLVHGVGALGGERAEGGEKVRPTQGRVRSAEHRGCEHVLVYPGVVGGKDSVEHLLQVVVVAVVPHQVVGEGRKSIREASLALSGLIVRVVGVQDLVHVCPKIDPVRDDDAVRPGRVERVEADH